MRYIVTILLLMLTLTSCQKEVKEEKPEQFEKTVTVRDFLGRTVHVPQNPQRIISLAPNMTELLYFLEADARLIGVTQYCNYPPEAQEKPVMGGFSDQDLNLEVIIAARPDLVLATPTKITPMVEKFDALDIPFYAFHPTNIPALLDGFVQIGRLTGTTATADSLVRAIKIQITQLQAMYQHTLPQTVFVEISNAPLMSATNETLVGQMLMLANGLNICGNLTGEYVQINPEFVLEQNPDVIIIAHMGSTSDDVQQRPGWDNLDAVRNGRIIDRINQDVIFRAGPRLMEGVWEFYNALHPEHPYQAEDQG